MPGSTATLGLEATRPAALIVVATLNFNIPGVAEPIVSISDDVGNLYASADAAGTWSGQQGKVEIWFATETDAGARAVTVTSAAPTTRSVWVLEFANMAPVDAIDAAAGVSDLSTGGQPAAPVVTPGRAPAVVVSVILLTGMVTQVAAGSPFVPLPLLNGDAAAYQIVDAPGTYGAVWDAPGSDNYSSSTAAFLGRE